MLGPARRLILEAAFLVALAVAAGLAELSSGQIIGVMALGWALTALVELVTWNLGARRSARREVPAVAPALPRAPAERPPVTEPSAEDRADEGDDNARAAEPSAEAAPVQPLRPPLGEPPAGEAAETEDRAPAQAEAERVAAERGSGAAEPAEGAEDSPAAVATSDGDEKAKAGDAQGPQPDVSGAHPPAASPGGEPEGRRRWFRRGHRAEATEGPEDRPPPRHVRLITRQDEPDADTDEHVLAPPEQRAGGG